MVDLAASEDFVYKNAPLIEVIAEVKWSLLPLAAVPGGAVDPFFIKGRNLFEERVKALGYVVSERAVPEGIPLELLARAPVFRFRREPNRWPLFQLGPGMFTCNMVPPYKGWSEYEKILGGGLEAIYASFPFDGQTARLEALELRYIDGFTRKHGLENYQDFLKDKLGLSVKLPQEFFEKLRVDEGASEGAFDLRMRLSDFNGTLSVKVAPGRVGNERAAIAEFHVSATADVPQASGEVRSWMHNAHLIVRNAFQSLRSQKLEDLMGPRLPVGSKL